MKRKIWVMVQGRPRHLQVECCLTCVCDWFWPRLPWPRSEGWRLPGEKKLEVVPKRSLRDRLNGI
jgi:hypothetical protein